MVAGYLTAITIVTLGWLSALGWFVAEVCETAYQLKYWINCTDLLAAQPIIPQRAKFICSASTIAPPVCGDSKTHTPTDGSISETDCGEFKVVRRNSNTKNTLG